MKTIVKLILSLMVIASIAVACTPKTDNSAQSESTATDSTEAVAPADSVEQPVDSASVN